VLRIFHTNYVLIFKQININLFSAMTRVHYGHPYAILIGSSIMRDVSRITLAAKQPDPRGPTHTGQLNDKLWWCRSISYLCR